MNSFEHDLRELQQIRLIEKKLSQMLETRHDLDKSETINEMVDDLDQISNFTTNLTNILSNKQTIDLELLTKLNHELRTTLVPIRAYMEMLLADKYGKLSDEQTNKLKIINSNIRRLEEAITNLLGEKQFNVIESEKKDQPNYSQTIKELEQERMILSKLVQSEEKTTWKMSRRFYVTIAAIAVAVSSLFAGYSYYENEVLINTTSRLLPNYNSNYVIQNLRGDVVNTWVSWRLVSGRVLNVDIINEAELSPDKIDAIKNAILSTETITIDDSLLHKGPAGTSSVYYKGWEGGLAAANSKPALYYIPQQFNIHQSPDYLGDITITLTNDESSDGLSGVTKSVVDGNQILKTKITIFLARQLSAEQLAVIMRHEFGHAMGLAHSSAPEDLMHATIQTDYPYISQCDIDAIKGLYNGNGRSAVVCQK